jgi:hypothetical protein
MAGGRDKVVLRKERRMKMGMGMGMERLNV